MKKEKTPFSHAKRPWQHALDNLLAAPYNDRKIIWIRDEKGGEGKTVYGKYLNDTEDDVIMLSMARKVICYM